MKSLTVNLHEGLGQGFLKVYLQETKDHTEVLRPCVVIIPGGGYISYLEDEAEETALFWLAKGFQVAIVFPSIGFPFARLPMPLMEISKAVRVLVDYSSQWGIDTTRLSLMGFSTGAHLASLLLSAEQGAQKDQEKLDYSLPIKPWALVLINPVLNFEASYNRFKQLNPTQRMAFEPTWLASMGPQPYQNEQLSKWSVGFHVHATMPTTFLWQDTQNVFSTYEDSMVFLMRLEALNLHYGSHFSKPSQQSNQKSNSIKRWYELIEESLR
jgi:acetyl esterase/lipase